MYSRHRRYEQISIDVISFLNHMPKPISDEINKLWDETHGNCYPECIYHHKIEHTKRSVLLNWFGTFDYKAGALVINYAKSYKPVFRKMTRQIQYKMAITEKWFKRRYGFTLYGGKQATHILVKIMERLIKIKEKQLMCHESIKRLFDIIEYYKIRHHDFLYGARPLYLEHDILNAIYIICKTPLIKKNKKIGGLR